MKRRFGRDYMIKLDDIERNDEIRVKPVYVRDVAGKQILTVLEEMIGRWSCHDVRYDGIGSDDQLLEDMIKGLERRVSRRVISEGVLEYSVEFIKNLDEIERYNAVVRGHNQKWVRDGKPVTTFDPLSGDVGINRDGFVDPVYTEGGRYKLPDSVYDSVADNGLTSVRPLVDRKSHIRVKYQVKIRGGVFVLGYAAYDYSDKVVYYNELEHKDLSYLVRRSVQEIWGNPRATKDFQPMLEGIPMLIHGDKLALCKEHSKFPAFMVTDSVGFKSTEKIRRMEGDEVTQIRLSNLTGFWLPLLTIFGFVGCFFWTCVLIPQADGLINNGLYVYEIPKESELIKEGFFFTTDKDEIPDSGYVVLTIPKEFGFFVLFLPVMVCILLLVSIYVMRFVSQGCDRSASEIRARRSFS